MCLRSYPGHYAGRCGVAAVAACGDVEDREDPDPAPPDQRAAAPAAAAAEAGLGGPGPARCPARRNTEGAAPGPAAAGYPGHDPALAPRHRPPPPGRPVRARQDRAGRQLRGTSRPWSAGWPARTRLGIPQDPRRDGRAGRQRRSTGRLGDPQGQRHRPGPAERAELAAVPAVPGRGDPGMGFFTAGLPMAPRPTSWP